MKRKWIIALVVVLVAGAGAYGFFGRTGNDGITYRFVAVEKGNLESLVSATGTLNAVKTVEVGTQVSGQLARIDVDFNDHVEQGQVIAVLDTTVLRSALEDATAQLDRNRAELDKAQRDLDRTSALHEQGISPDADLNTAEYDFDVAKASMRSAQAAVERARQNLAYATITAPVSGTVVERDVDVGQTVAASLSAPKLFVIANDLAHMQILVPVDESDIGRIAEGQTVRFTVKAYPERTYTGTVRQVRLQSTTEQNVVSYTVVVDVANPDHSLLPGMTATVDFLVASASDVFKVPNAALRFRPTEAMLAELRQRRQEERAARAGSEGASSGGWGGRRAAEAGGTARPKDLAVLWFVDGTGKLAATPVHTGITDGQDTAVTGHSLQAGMQVIAGMTRGTDTQASSNPFTSSQQSGPPRFRPGAF